MSVSVSEPRFRPGDVDVLLASRRQELAPRNSHGVLMAEATDPKHQYDWVVDTPIRDHAALAVERASEAYRKLYGDDAHMSSLIFPVRLRENG